MAAYEEAQEMHFGPGVYNDSDDDELWKAFDNTMSLSVHDGLHLDDQKKEVEYGANGVCPHCSSRKIESRYGNYECMECNTIVNRMIDNSPEWRFYGNEDNRASNPTRCGPPSSSLMPGLGSSVQGFSSSRSHFTKWGLGSNGGSCKALQKLHMWNAMTHRERTLYHVFEVISTVSNNNGIALCIVEEAKSLYKRVSESRITRGENRKAIIACSVYVACKSNGVPRSIKEISLMFDVNKCAMTKACKIFQDFLCHNLISSGPNDFVARFCSKLNLGPDVLSTCREIIRIIDDRCITTDSTPPSLVASVILMCCNASDIRLPKSQIAEECQLSQVTITKCYKILMRHANVLLPPAFLTTSPEGETSISDATRALLSHRRRKKSVTTTTAHKKIDTTNH